MKEKRLQVTQQRDGYVLQFGKTIAGGESFIEALRDLYRRVPQTQKEFIEKIGRDGKVRGFVDGFRV